MSARPSPGTPSNRPGPGPEEAAAPGGILRDASQGRPPWSFYREALESRGFHPSRKLGQNFLVDENMVRAIARDSGVQSGDFVLEVGPGCGFLTRELLAQGARVLAAEIDERLADVCRSTLGELKGWELVLGDALAGKHRLAPALEERLPTEGCWRLVSNLPYSAGTPIVCLLARLPHPPGTMTVLLQRELGERMVATPGSSAWGALSARLQVSYDAKLVRVVPAGLFWPRPKVESAVVHLARRGDAPPRGEALAFDAFLNALFARRRQSLGRVVREMLAGDREGCEGVLSDACLEGTQRAEGLDLSELQALHRSLGPVDPDR